MLTELRGIKDILKLFREEDHFLLTTHEGPDADGIGAEIVLFRALRHLGKTVRVVNSEALSERYSFLDPEGVVEGLDEAVHAAYAEGSIVVVLDCSDLFNLGLVADQLVPRAKAVFVIDHHEVPPNSTVRGLLDPAAAATCEMTVELVRELGIPIDGVSAKAAFAGIVYDTGSFIYPKTSASTFRTALSLVEAGVVPIEIHRAMNESASLGALLLQKTVLSSLELHEGGRIALQTMVKADLERAGASYDEAESLINIPLKSKDVEVSVFFKENPEGRLRCSLRSKGAVNVSLLAQSFGGGGHRTAAGFKCAKGLAETRDEVLHKISAALNAASSGER